MRSDWHQETPQDPGLFNSKKFNLSARPDQRHPLVFNASISMQMWACADVDYLPLAAFCRVTFPPRVTTVFAPLSCLSNIESLSFLEPGSICLSRIRTPEAYKCVCVWGGGSVWDDLCRAKKKICVFDRAGDGHLSVMCQRRRMKGDDLDLSFH